MHILVLTDRDWSHPEAGGTGTTLRSLVWSWVDAGHRVTVIAGAFAGSVAIEHPRPGLEVRRMGTRLTVFPRAALACLRGVGRDADVVFEVINGIAFFTPLWRFLRTPKVVFLQHVHQHHYVMELGLLGRVAALVLEWLPLRLLYRGTPICAISHAARNELIEMGVPAATIEVVYLGVSIERNGDRKAVAPTLLYLGRLKRYKRLGVLLDVLEAAPDARLEVAGDGDQRGRFQSEIERRGLGDRVVMHGFVSEEDKAALCSRAWLAVTASGAEGWGLTVMEAAMCGTPTAALRVGGLAEAIVDGETGALADDVPGLAARVREILESPELRTRLGAAASRRARTFTWERAAGEILELLVKVAADGRVRYRMPRPEIQPSAEPGALITNGGDPDRERTVIEPLPAHGTGTGIRRTAIQVRSESTT